MKNPKISILIVTYNPWDYIINTLKSILNQSYNDFEILILDNNSSDNTIKNINSFNNKKINIFEWKKNIWPYEWLNFLLEKAKWKFIAIQDHDDIWHKDKLKIQIEFLEKNMEYIWCWTETVMYYEVDKKYFLYYLWEKNFYTIHPSLIFRNTWDFKYDNNLIYFWDAYSIKYNLCKWKKIIYNIKKPLTLHIIKSSYNNFTYSWFKFKLNYFKRIFKVHNFSFYAFLVLFYEIIKKIIFPIFNFFKIYNLYILFDRLPYKISWNKIRNIRDSKNKYINEMRDSFL